MITALDHAVTLATYRGWQVFPCRRDKKPATPNGFKNATNDPAEVRELFMRHPGPLAGIATGQASGLAVLDLDVKDGAGAWWAENRHQMPQTRTVRTRSGGLHLYFRHKHGLRCSASVIAPGVDVRADGGYVIAWDGAGLPVLHETDPAPWPDVLIEAMRPSRQRLDPDKPAVITDQSLAGLIRFVAGAGEGERNSRLFWAAIRAGEAIRDGKLTEASAAAMLAPAARETGLPFREIEATISSGLRTGMEGAPHAG